MDTVQQLALASGIAFGGGLLGAAVSALVVRRRQAREARLLGRQLATSGTLPLLPDSHPLAPLLDALGQRIEVLQERHEEQDAQRRQLSADLVRLMQQTDGALRAKDRFVAAISHDLRQPLQSMDLALEQLRRHAPGSQARDLQQLQAGMRTLTEVLDGLLLLSQLDAGSLRPQPAHCPLQDLFAEVIASQAEAADRAGVRVHARAGDLAAYTDAGMLASLLARLLENAIKASPRGGRVLLAARRHGEQLRIEVRDGGIGIAPIHQPRVFDEFFQVGNPERDHRKGFGLGLSIVSRLAGLLGTRVELRSRLHAGTCFSLVLPRANVVQRLPRVLVLDGDEQRRGYLASLLEGWGYAVQAEAPAANACFRLGAEGGSVEALLCAVADGDDPAWQALLHASRCHGEATLVVLCNPLSPAILELASRLGAEVLPLPPPPAKLRSLLAQRPGRALRGAA